jgi:hypothetical protein
MVDQPNPKCFQNTLLITSEAHCTNPKIIYLKGTKKAIMGRQTAGLARLVEVTADNWDNPAFWWCDGNGRFSNLETDFGLQSQHK